MPADYYLYIRDNVMFLSEYWRRKKKDTMIENVVPTLIAYLWFRIAVEYVAIKCRHCCLDKQPPLQ